MLLARNGKGKAIPVTCREGPYGCETSRLPHFLDNRPTDGGEVVSLTHRPPFTPQKNSWYSLLLEAELTPGLSDLSIFWPGGNSKTYTPGILLV
jgi:hypothetical protein